MLGVGGGGGFRLANKEMLEILIFIINAINMNLMSLFFPLFSNANVLFLPSVIFVDNSFKHYHSKKVF